jgi:hypothetical protein
MEFGLIIGYIGPLQLVTTDNYNNFTSFCTLLFIVTCTMSSQSSLGALWQRLPIFHVQRLLSSLVGVYLTTNLVLLHSGLQQLGLLRLSHLCQGQLSATTSDGSVSQLLAADSRIYCSVAGFPARAQDLLRLGLSRTACLQTRLLLH